MGKYREQTWDGALESRKGSGYDIRKAKASPRNTSVYVWDQGLYGGGTGVLGGDQGWDGVLNGDSNVDLAGFSFFLASFFLLLLLLLPLYPKITIRNLELAVTDFGPWSLIHHPHINRF